MKKKLIIGCIIAVIAIAGFFVWKPTMPKVQESASQTVTLHKTDLVDSVLVSGIVKSSSVENVYSKVSNYPIKKVYFEVGDRVRAGDVLAELDTAALTLDIKQTELNIRNAELALKNEDNTLQYNLENAMNNVESASIELSNAKSAFEQIKALYDSGASSSDELSKAEASLQRAQLSYDNAKAALDNMKSKNSYTTRNNIEIQKVGLEKLKKTLNDTKIVAPIDGTLTMVNARENGTAAGLLFVVEDTEELVVSTAIGEYDISLIQLGQEVIIKSDSTGDKQFLGIVSEIAPTAVKDAAGNTASTSNVQFDAEVALKEMDPNIKIGMNVRMTIKLNEKKDVFSVPYDAIVTDGNGTQYINVVENIQKDGKTQSITRKIQVQAGMETDMHVEISSPELKDGMIVQVGTKAV